jgi:hypothetical protein
MLTRFTSVISIAILATGAAVALNPAPASAGKPPRVHAHVGYTRTVPGNTGRPTGGGGGKAGPPPCPANTNCNTMGAGNAVVPAVQVRTIDVALDAYDQLAPPTPHIHTSPANRTYVQLKTGLWLDPGDYQQETAVATAGGQTVTAIGTPKNVTWNMGESTVTCGSAGSARKTRCGYTYQRSSAGRPNGKYAISVTVTWDVRWTCQGAQCESAGAAFDPPTMSMTSNTTLAVGEVQTESRPG